MFDLKQPCNNCPFRKDHGHTFALGSARLREIKTATAFQCHKTVDYDNYDDDEKRSGARPQQCAGLMAVLLRDGSPNNIMQIAQRIGGIDFSGLDPKREAYESWADVIAAHCQWERK